MKNIKKRRNKKQKVGKDEMQNRKEGIKKNKKGRRKG